MPDMVGFPTDGDDGSVSSEARWRQMARLWAPSGVVAGYLGDLAPSLSAGTITVQAGAAWVDGHYCEATGSSTFTATVTGLVVVRFTPADNHFELLYRDGATTPTQTTATWELPIARITASVLYDVRAMLPVGGDTTGRLANISLTAAAAQIDFENIPQTATHLRLVAALRGDTAGASVIVNLRANGDSGASQYDYQVMRGSGTTATVTFNGGTTGVGVTVPAASTFGTSFAAYAADIPAYRTSGMRRTFIISNGASMSTAGAPTSGDLRIESVFGWWRSGTAISRLTLAPGSGNLLAGSTATLYGTF